MIASLRGPMAMGQRAFVGPSAAPRARPPCAACRISSTPRALRTPVAPPSQPLPASCTAPCPPEEKQEAESRHGDASTSGQHQGGHTTTLVALSLSTLLGAGLCFPASSQAAELLSGPVLEYFTAFLTQIEAMGPWGWLIYVLTLTVCESIPLLPTLPLSLSGGLLFGGQKGAALVLLGGTLAALNAFYLSRGIGGPFVQRLIDSEMGGGKAKTGAAAKFAEVQEIIKSGGFWKQYWAVTLLRLTPIVPFSASNYLLGLTPIQPAAFLFATITGCSVWSVAYASLGGASASLLKKGVDPELLLIDLAEKASMYSHTAGVAAAAAGVVAAGYFGMTTLMKSRGSTGGALLGRDLQEGGSSSVPPGTDGPPGREAAAEDAAKVEQEVRRRDETEAAAASRR